MFANAAVQKIWETTQKRDGAQKEFLQAVQEVLETLEPVFEKHPHYIPVMERMIEPERAIQFRVPYLDDNGAIQVNRGFRVQYNGAIGPYKGGLRLHPTVNLSVIKFLGFEQIFKNSLTGLPMGGGKGGSDFDPKGKSNAEVMRFCQSFMTELYRHIGPNCDVPAGDIGVGGREIGFMFGQYRRMTGRFEGVLTGKGPNWGGSRIRPEATGYGTVYYAEHCLNGIGKDFKGKIVTLSGSGNVAQYATEKLIELGAKAVTMSDSSGYVHEPEGFTTEQLSFIMDLKNVKRGRISEYAKFSKTASFHAGVRPWEVKCDVALPCATQNEVNKAEAEALAKNGCICVAEGANMPSDPEAIAVYHANKIVFGPAKAANAGGVAVSGLEMSQNSERLRWTREEVDSKLKGIMKGIYEACDKYAKEYNTHLQAGANMAGFIKVADSMIDQGCI